MKPRNIIVVVIFLVVAVGVWQFILRREPPPVKVPVEQPPVVRPAETPAEREARWNREARTAFAAAITNDLPGHKRTIRTEDTIVASQPASNWTANAAVEYVDQNGSFARTTLFWKFEITNDAVRIIPVPY